MENPHALLVELQTGEATVKISMELHQKIKSEIALWLRDFTYGNLSEEHWNTNLKEYMHHLFIVALFKITKIWKQPKFPPVDEWIKQLWDIYTMKYYSALKKKKKNSDPLQQYGWTWKVLC